MSVNDLTTCLIHATNISDLLTISLEEPEMYFYGRIKMAELKPGIYRHFKGNLYEVMSVATHSETREELVVYRALYGDYGLFVRPVSMFIEQVDRDGYSGPRFELVKAF